MRAKHPGAVWGVHRKPSAGQVGQVGQGGQARAAEEPEQWTVRADGEGDPGVPPVIRDSSARPSPTVALRRSRSRQAPGPGVGVGVVMGRAGAGQRPRDVRSPAPASSTSSTPAAAPGRSHGGRRRAASNSSVNSRASTPFSNVLRARARTRMRKAASPLSSIPTGMSLEVSTTRRHGLSTGPEPAAQSCENSKESGPHAWFAAELECHHTRSRGYGRTEPIVIIAVEEQALGWMVTARARVRVRRRGNRRCRTVGTSR